MLTSAIYLTKSESANAERKKHTDLDLIIRNGDTDTSERFDGNES